VVAGAVQALVHFRRKERFAGLRQRPGGVLGRAVGQQPVVKFYRQIARIGVADRKAHGDDGRNAAGQQRVSRTREPGLVNEGVRFFGGDLFFVAVAAARRPQKAFHIRAATAPEWHALKNASLGT